MVWLNVDITNKMCILHIAGCIHKPAREPAHKGFERLKRNGGWFTHDTPEVAEIEARQRWPTYQLIRCLSCGA